MKIYFFTYDDSFFKVDIQVLVESLYQPGQMQKNAQSRENLQPTKNHPRNHQHSLTLGELFFRLIVFVAAIFFSHLDRSNNQQQIEKGADEENPCPLVWKVAI